MRVEDAEPKTRERRVAINHCRFVQAHIEIAGTQTTRTLRVVERLAQINHPAPHQQPPDGGGTNAIAQQVVCLFGDPPKEAGFVVRTDNDIQLTATDSPEVASDLRCRT